MASAIYGFFYKKHPLMRSEVKVASLLGGSDAFVSGRVYPSEVGKTMGNSCTSDLIQDKEGLWECGPSFILEKDACPPTLGRLRRRLYGTDDVELGFQLLLVVGQHHQAVTLVEDRLIMTSRAYRVIGSCSK